MIDSNEHDDFDISSAVTLSLKQLRLWHQKCSYGLPYVKTNFIVSCVVSGLVACVTLVFIVTSIVKKEFKFFLPMFLLVQMGLICGIILLNCQY